MAARKTSPLLPVFLASVFAAATGIGAAITLIFYFSSLQGWFFTRVW